MKEIPRRPLWFRKDCGHTSGIHSLSHCAYPPDMFTDVIEEARALYVPRIVGVAEPPALKGKKA